MDRIGRDPAGFRWIYYTIMYPGAWEEIAEHVWAMSWKYSDMTESTTRPGPPPAAPPPPADAVEKMRSRGVTVGSPDQIVASLGELQRQAGVPIDFVARSYFATLDQGRQRELLEQLAAEVLPHLPSD
jgi:hypothetical protein